jgi:hypothetical protein
MQEKADESKDPAEVSEILARFRVNYGAEDVKRYYPEAGWRVFVSVRNAVTGPSAIW